ncbi:MAG: hypothetical protein LC746_15095 [Acidobacteria bacterium]|nr:hypothetical protein [Acidobacteriota bacterium]
MRRDVKPSLPCRLKTPLLCCLLLTQLACARQSPGANAAAATKGGACALLSGSDVKSVQGEDVAQTQSSERASGALHMSQCFYRLPTFNKSVNLEIISPARADREGAEAVERYWEERFHRSGESESEAEREQEQKRGGAKGERQGEEQGRGEQGSEASRPQPVSGVGDEAFWAGNQISASLYVHKKGAVVRISLGGAEDPADKIKRAAALAQQVLKRL